MVKAPKYKLFKTGTLMVTCRGSGLQVWFGSKYHPVAEKDIPRFLKEFCMRCEVRNCEGREERESET